MTVEHLFGGGAQPGLILIDDRADEVTHQTGIAAAVSTGEGLAGGGGVRRLVFSIS